MPQPAGAPASRELAVKRLKAVANDGER